MMLHVAFSAILAYKQMIYEHDLLVALIFYMYTYTSKNWSEAQVMYLKELYVYFFKLIKTNS